jgi:hypothetical protein
MKYKLVVLLETHNFYAIEKDSLLELKIQFDNDYENEICRWKNSSDEVPLKKLLTGCGKLIVGGASVDFSCSIKDVSFDNYMKIVKEKLPKAMAELRQEEFELKEKLYKNKNSTSDLEFLQELYNDQP